MDGVIDVNLESLEATLPTLSEDAQELLVGQLTDSAGPVGVIDPTAVFALRDTLPGARRAG